MGFRLSPLLEARPSYEFPSYELVVKFSGISILELDPMPLACPMLFSFLGEFLDATHKMAGALWRGFGLNIVSSVMGAASLILYDFYRRRS